MLREIYSKKNWYRFKTVMKSWKVVYKVTTSFLVFLRIVHTKQDPKEMEKLRVNKTIGSSLDAEIDLFVQDELIEMLSKLGEELRFVLITSYVRLHPLSEKPDTAVAAEGLNEVFLSVKASEYKKCTRCWHHREDVGSDKNHPELCGRCVENVSGSGETRSFV